ncbi:MAG TPA: thioredoxin domain-containing protein [Pirellulaceae bacterium]|nr:thioredoxin domain-containing protein [Pirellulaceae bacterium]
MFFNGAGTFDAPQNRDFSKMPNRLIDATSPYLLQHAHNPVAWYPWSEAALTAARDQDKPIFLSIGYSACHWCHVMERESFEDDDTAAYLNQHFVSIKVDREERPDLDQIYMKAVMALRDGHGGWPLSAFLTPSGHVFFGGTYWPREPRYGMPAFRQILERVIDVFRHRRGEVEAQSLEVTRWLHQMGSGDSGRDESQGPIDLSRAAAQLEQAYDFAHGGIGGAPKFPHAMHLEFLLRWALSSGRSELPRWMRMVEHNLTCMARGGIYDHLGGGFARYSVDEKWLVPHFEKMLYDNALLARMYLMAGLAMRRDELIAIGRDTLEYLLRDMRHPEGGFYSAEDADSEGEEGKFYVWDQDEIEQLLGSARAQVFCAGYGVTRSGNFEGRNVLHISETTTQLSARLGIPEEDVESILQSSREELFAARAERIRPQRDEKILLNWNALAISALATGSIVVDDSCYFQAACEAWQFIERHMIDADGRLLHSWKDVPGAPGFLDDYAFAISALIDLYQVSFDEQWINRAVSVAEAMLTLFADEQGGGLFYVGHDVAPLIVRMKEYQESSIPSGNAMAAWALARLARLIDRPEWRERAQQIVDAGMKWTTRSLLDGGQLLVAAWELATEAPELVLSSRLSVEREGLRLLWAATLQGSSIAARCDPSKAVFSEWLEPLFQGRVVDRGHPTLYVCRGRQCEAPMVGAEAFTRYLQSLQLHG